jgi:hypothetical protein
LVCVKLEQLSGRGEIEGQGNRSVCAQDRILLVARERSRWAPPGGKFVGAKRHMKLRCVNWKKKLRSALTS